MKKFDLSPLAAFPRFIGASRAVLSVAVVAVYSYALATAGPGNGVQPPRERLYVTLPPVLVVGQREAAPQAVVASAAVVKKVTLTR